MATVTVTDPSSLIARLRSAAPRDTILVAGKFGSVNLEGIRPDQTVTIAAAAPGAAHFEQVVLNNCANLSFSGLQFWPLAPVKMSKRKLYLFTAFPNCAGIEVSKSLFRGRADSDDHPRWSLADWNEGKIGAVSTAE